MFKKERGAVAKTGPGEITLRFDKEQVNFLIGGQAVGFMIRDRFLELFNPELISRAFEEPRINLSFSEVCRIIRFLKKGLGLDLAAKIGGLGLEGSELRRAFAEAMERYGIAAGENKDRVSGEIEKQVQEADDQDAVILAKPNLLFGPGLQKAVIDLIGFKKYLAGGGSLDEFIKSGNFDKGDFKTFMKKNQKYLDLIP